jgi:acetoin utilization deacetylase AcuC-like enzyme
MGFCLYNSIAVAAADALERHELDRVLIVDFDVHHGNGTQEIFYEDPRVGFLSIHRHPFYPGSGTADETGSRAGLGTTRNVPIRYGTHRDAYHAAFRSALEDMADRLHPQLVLISAGFDAHEADPIGSLGLEAEDFARLTHVIRDVAGTHAAGRVVSLLEGGYNLATLPQCVLAHVEALGAAPLYDLHH